MEWRMEEIFKLIAYYRRFPCLWDLKSQHYKRTDMKRNAWQEISKNMEKSEEEVRKKIKNLRSVYVSEKKKVDCSKKSGSSAEDLYHPHLFYYNELNFLDSAVMYRKTKSNLPINDIIQLGSESCVVAKSCSLEDSCLLNSLEDSQESSSLSISTLETPTTSKNYNRSLKKIKIDRDEKFNTAINAIVKQADMACSLMTPNAEQDNMYTAFGKSIALQLAQLSLIAATEAMSDIQNILSIKIQRDVQNDILQTAKLKSDMDRKNKK